MSQEWCPVLYWARFLAHSCSLDTTGAQFNSIPFTTNLYKKKVNHHNILTLIRLLRPCYNLKGLNPTFQFNSKHKKLQNKQPTSD